MSDVADRQRVRVEDDVRGEIRHRHLRRGNQVERRFVNRLELVFLELGQLAGADQRLRFHEIRYVRLRVAVFAGVRVEHELDERALQPCELSFHHDEAGAGDLARGFEVELAEAFAKLDMVARCEIALRRLAPRAHFGIVVLAIPGRDVVGEQVRQSQLDVAQALLNLLQGCLARLEPVAEILNSGKQRRDILALRLRLADALRARIALALQLLGLDLNCLAAFLQGQVRVGIELEAAAREIRGNFGCRLTE